MHDYLRMLGDILGLSDSSPDENGSAHFASGAEGDLGHLTDRLAEALASGHWLDATPEGDTTGNLGPPAANLATNFGTTSEHDLPSPHGIRFGEWNDPVRDSVDHGASPPGVVVNQVQHINLPPSSKDSSSDDLQRDLGVGAGGTVAVVFLQRWLGAHRRAEPSKTSRHQRRSAGESQRSG